MIDLPIELQYRENAVQAPVAWLVPGDDPAKWFAEWARWQNEIGDWPIAVLPGLGVLTLPSPKPQQVSPQCLALYRLGDKTFVPTLAALQPNLQSAELDKLLPREIAWAVFHPRQGLVIIPEEGLSSVQSLLRPPPASSLDWGLADPGPALNERLIRILPEAPPALEMILAAGREDIGSQAKPASGLPSRPGEPASGMIQGLGRAMQAALAKAVLATLGGVGNRSRSGKPRQASSGQAGQAAGAGGGAGSWFSAAFSWAANKLNKIQEDLEALRHREIIRLMHLLESDPDEGLKFALPLGGDEQHRGLGAAGGLLPERDVNFSLGRFGSGGAVDPWALPDKYALDLARRYRDLANRELQLGRYRRAAYILGELLRDPAAAAGALEVGGYFREAAILYAGRLKNQPKAAECLERGGLIPEAIEVYERLRQHEKVGDLYARLEQPEEAELAWKKAAQIEEERGDHLAAARICREKRKNANDALAVLNRGWPHSRQAQECLSRWFRLHGELGNHDVVQSHLKALAKLPDSDLAARAAPPLVRVATQYPDRITNDLAADSLRLLCAAHLQASGSSERDTLLNSLAALETGDRILARDCQRFRQSRTPRSAPAASRVGNQLRLVHTIRLPPAGKWLTAASQGKSWLALGVTHSQLIVVRGDWLGKQQIIQVHDRGGHRLTSESCFFAADAQGRFDVRVGPCEETFVRSFPAIADFPTTLKLRSIETQFPTNGQLLGAAYALRTFNLLKFARATNQVEKWTYGGEDFQSVVDMSVVVHAKGDLPATIPIVGDPDYLALGWHRHLVVLGAQQQSLELRGPIRSLAASAPHTLSRIAAGLDHGAAIVWRATRLSDSKVLRFADDLYQPRVCFMGAGLVVASSENGTQVYQTKENQLTSASGTMHHGERPWALLPTAHGAQFAMFLPSGDIRVYEVG